MMVKSFRKVRLLLITLAAVAGLVGCGVLVDSTPPTVSLFTPTGEVEEGHQLIGVRAVDQESGIKSILVERFDADSEQWNVDKDEVFTAEAVDDSEDEAGSPVRELQRTREVIVELPVGEHELRVTVVNGSNREAVLEQRVGSPIVLSPVQLELLPVVEVIEGTNQVRAEMFTIRFTVSGDHTGEAELWMSRNGAAALMLEKVDVPEGSGMVSTQVDGGVFNVGDSLELSVRVKGLDGGTAVAELPPLVIAPRTDQVNPEQKPLLMNVNVKPAGTVTRSEGITVTFSVTGGVGGVETVNLFVSVNDEPEEWLELLPGGPTPFTGEFSVNASDYGVGDNLAFRVEANDQAGQDASAGGEVRVVAPEEAVADPLEVSVTRVTKVNREHELLDDQDSFEVHFIAESGVLIDRVDLMSSRNDAPMKLLQRQTHESRNVSSFFSIDSSDFQAGDEYRFEVVARDANNRTAKTDAVTVLVVSPPPVAIDDLEVSIGSTPLTVMLGNELTVPYAVTSGAGITEVALWVEVNGGAADRYQVAGGGVSPVSGEFVLGVDSPMFSAGDELLLEVRAKDDAGQESIASVNVNVVATPVVTPDPLEVNIIDLIGVSGGELLSTATEFQITYSAQSGAPITRVELLRSRNGGAFQLIDVFEPGTRNTNGQFVVNAVSYEAGDEYEFRVDAVDEAEQRASSDVAAVTVVAPPPVVLDPVEAFLLRVEPSTSAGEIERTEWSVHFTSNTDESLTVRHASLFVSVNGGAERMVERINAASGVFRVDGMSYSIGDEVSFEVEVEDDRGPSSAARSAPFVVTVVGTPEPVPADPTASAIIVEPVVSGGMIPRETVTIRVNGTSGVDLTMAKLLLSVNGAPAAEVDAQPLAGLSSTTNLTAHSNLFDEGDDLQFSVLVRDELDRVATSNTVSVSVIETPDVPVDDTPPVSESLIIRTDDPSNRFIDRNGIVIEFAASDDTELAQLRLLESINGGPATLIPHGLIDASGGYFYDSTLDVSTSHYSKGDVVVFTLESLDAAGNTDTLSSRPYEVVEFVESSGYLVSELPDSLEVEDDLQLNIALYDDGSTGVSSFDLYLNGTLTPFEISSDGRVYSYAWEVGTLAPGVHTIVIVVKFEDDEFTPVLIMHTLRLTAPSEDDEVIGP